MKKISWLIWDAASKNIFDILIKNNELKYLQNLFAEGTSYRVKSNEPNCQTPCALAVQFTGKKSHDLEISGYSIPNIKNNNISTDKINSFELKNIQKYVLWNKNYIGYKNIILCECPFGNKKQNSIKIFNNFKKILYKSQIYTWNTKYQNIYDLEFAETKYKLKYIKSKLITIFNEHGNFEINLTFNVKNNHIACCDIWLGENYGFKIFLFLIEEHEIKILCSDVFSSEISESLSEKFNKFVGVFIGKAYGKLYRNNLFGLTYYAKGCGRAEEIYKFILKEMAECFMRVSIFAMRNYDFEFIISYQPCIDEMSHEVYGLYHNAVDDKEKSFYYNLLSYAYNLADQHLKAINDENENLINIVSSDHGIYYVKYIFHINEWLKRKRYLYINDGRIDINKSIIFYHYSENGSLFFNKKVDKAKQQKIINEMLEIKFQNQTMIRKIESQENKIFGDYFLYPSGGVAVDSNFSNTIFENSEKTGAHTINTNQNDLDSILYLQTKENLFDKNIEINNTEIKDIIIKCIMKN